MTHRSWCFTHFLQDDEPPFAGRLPGSLILGAIWQLELCPTTGRRHLQGFVKFKRPVRMQQCIDQLKLRGVHVERRHPDSTDLAAIDYASKEDTRLEGPWRQGKLETARGARNDLAAIHSALRAGASDAALSDDYFGSYLRYYRGISQWRALHAPRRREKTQVIVFHGPTGTGKSQAAWCIAPEAYIFSPDSSPSGVGWWCGYDAHSHVIIDDFYGNLRFSFMLQLMDRYPLRLQTKGGGVEFVASTLMITSNKHPSDWYNFDKLGPHAWPAFERRLDHIYDCQPTIYWRQK